MTDSNEHVRMITLPSGLQVGIQGLSEIISQIAGLNFQDPEEIRKELIRRVGENSYIARGAEKEYSAALMREYNRATGAGVSPPVIEPKSRHAG